MKKVQRLAPIINAMIDEYKMNAVKGGLQEIVSKIKKALRQEGLTHKLRVVPLRAGVHPSNRSGDGLDAKDVHGLLNFITTTHWSWIEVANAWACEVAPSGARGDRYKTFNVELSVKSNGLLAPVDKDTLQVVTLTTGHTTAGLRCVAAGTRDIDSTISEGGQLSLAMLSAKDPVMGDAVRNGIEYEVLCWQIDEECPRICPLIIEADNLTHRAARQDLYV
jgi:hypothetical protein